jgi:hypothetical protein
MNSANKRTATKRILSAVAMATGILLSGSTAKGEPMKTNDTSTSKSTPAGMNPGVALQAADAVALRDHRAALPKAAELAIIPVEKLKVRP